MTVTVTVTVTMTMTVVMVMPALVGASCPVLPSV
ncbi:hypothetical protein BJ982_006815 [Sphaerisporangium siamense]|uniref:Uncharacterized protein n=1 Tax=Sphaerisporangium siamense TaxID=795645 RepID=A0A7W7DEQ8_9ACTN|nr:hypothetical protein [Sphaerisporangium siamense]